MTHTDAVEERTCALLGRGGANPGITAYFCISGETRDAVSLQCGQSVCSLAWDGAVGPVVAGTRRGEIHWVRRGCSADERSVDYWVPGTVSRGRVPVLDVCPAADTLTAVADVKGGLRLHRPGDSGPVPARISSPRTFCALARYDADRIVGLATTGELAVCAAPYGGLDTVCAGPEPPDCWSLVRLVWWRGPGFLVYPSRSGDLVRLDVSTGSIDCLPAHAGEWYAVCTWGDRLVTAGRRDRRLLVWGAGVREPVDEYTCPNEVLALAQVGESPLQLILVEAGGSASVAELVDGRLRVSAVLPGRDYRTVIGPRDEALRREQAGVTTTRVSQIALALETPTVGAAKALSLHADLEELGYPHVSAALKARSAEAAGHILEELSHHMEFARLVADNCPQAVPMLERYASVLESLWQFDLSLGAWDRALAVSPAPVRQEARDRVAFLLNACQGGGWLGMSSLPVADLAAAADLLGRPFSGRWLVRLGEALDCRGVVSGPADLIAALPPAVDGCIEASTVTRIHFLSTDGSAQREAAVMRGPAVGDGISPELVVSFADEGGVRQMVPMVALAVDHVAQSNGAPVVSSVRVRMALRALEGGSGEMTWAEGVAGMLRSAVRRLVTRSLCEKRRRRT